MPPAALSIMNLQQNGPAMPRTAALDKTRIDLTHNARAKAAEMLNQLLADITDLSMQTKHGHWNVKGPQFIALHKYFDELHGAVDEHVDAIAERIAALGGQVRGRLGDAAKASRLKPFPDGAEQGMDAVRALADATGATANAMREAIDTAEELGDTVTADLLTGVAGDLDKHLWFLEAHLR